MNDRTFVSLSHGRSSDSDVRANIRDPKGGGGLIIEEPPPPPPPPSSSSSGGIHPAFLYPPTTGGP